jgi:hypothetical protein
MTCCVRRHGAYRAPQSILKERANNLFPLAGLSRLKFDTVIYDVVKEPKTASTT